MDKLRIQSAKEAEEIDREIERLKEEVKLKGEGKKEEVKWVN